MPVEMTHGVTDLATDAMRARAFRREVELIGDREQAKAQRMRDRAARLPLRSNGRRKLEAKAAELEAHVSTLTAATV